ncbi:putative hydrolase [Biscogniauxia sp. FL1348]|nr:putative hydrolase [Biscogniauxia sp. FL1348]
MSQYSSCCVQGFNWEGTPGGRETKLGETSTYVSGSNPDAAVLVIHDLFGWTFPNLRLLADHYAKEADVTAYLPDFFGGEALPADILQDQSRWGEIDIESFCQRNSREARRDEIFACARALRARYKRVGAVGFCYGGWAVFELGARGNGLIDCIATAHPSWLTTDDIDKVGVPVLVQAPERDPVYTQDLKDYTHKVIPTLGVAYEYQFFPGVEHGFAVRGNPKDLAERKAMQRAKNSAVAFFRQWLHE